MKSKGLFGLLAALACCFCCSLLRPWRRVIKLTLSDQNPSTGWGPVHALQPWVKKVEEATKDRVKIDIFPAQTLAKGRTSLTR